MSYTELSEFCRSISLPLNNLEQVITQYKRPSARFSLTYSEKLSSSKISNRTHLDMAHFRRSWLADSSTMPVRLYIMDINVVEEYVKTTFFDGNAEQFNLYMLQARQKLQLYRSIMLADYEAHKKPAQEVLYTHPLVNGLLQGFIEDIPAPLHVFPVPDGKLTVELELENPNCRIISGFTDLLVSADSDFMQTDGIRSFFELKPPFGHLASRLSVAHQKDQLLIQLAGMKNHLDGRMKKRKKKVQHVQQIVKGGLTDGFALYTAFLVDNQYYLSNRLTDERAVILGSLLLFDDSTTQLNADRLRRMLNDSTRPLSTDDEEEDEEDEDKVQKKGSRKRKGGINEADKKKRTKSSTAKKTTSSQQQGKKKTMNKISAVKCIRLATAEDEDREAELRYLLDFRAKLLGPAYLSEYQLDKENAAPVDSNSNHSNLIMSRFLNDL